MNRFAANVVKILISRLSIFALFLFLLMSVRFQVHFHHLSLRPAGIPAGDNAIDVFRKTIVFAGMTLEVSAVKYP